MKWPRTEEGYLACVRSGYCCRQATCGMGVMHGAPLRGCTFLEGSSPGGYSCRLVKERPELAESMYIGAGCSSTLMNQDRVEALHRLTGTESSDS
jgi:hypothetical protein